MAMNFNIREMLGKYEDAVEFAEIKIPAQVILIITLGMMFISIILGLMADPTLGFLLAVLSIDLGLGLPFFLVDRKVDDIENRLPDVLHHMATTLKTGGTVETSLREVSRIDYGPISKNLKVILREMSEGKTFEDAFSDFAVKSRSEMLRRAAIIIIAARRAGGGLLDTLAAMAEDIRAMARLKRERKTKTFMQFLFILVAGCFVAPFIFGIVKSVMDIMIRVGGTTSMGEVAATISQFDTLFKSYLIIAAALTTFGAVLVREGRWTKAIVYIPIGVLVTYVIYTMIAGMFLHMLGI
jgi:pilus assembly protein TadC